MNPEELRLRLGQRICVGFAGYEFTDEERKLIREYKIGNIILFKRNIKSREQLKSLCDDARKMILEETGIQPFIMIDEECGGVSRLAHITVPTPCAMAIGATGDPENAKKIARNVGEELRAVGINFDLAPVLDCFTNPNNTVCGNRCFAVSPDEVSSYGLAYIQGLHDAGVMACGKHFPGHGDTDVDSHLALPVVNKRMSEMEKTELVPFKEAIKYGIDAIMSTHVVFPAVERGTPATVSRRVMTGLLREKMGFKGLILSDSMDMKAVKDLYGIPEGTLRALRAGVDIVLICYTVADGSEAIKYIEKAYEDGQLDPEEISKHFQHIVNRKAGITEDDNLIHPFGTLEQADSAREIMKISISLINAPGGKRLPEIDSETVVFGTKGRRNTLANDENTYIAAREFAKALGARYIEKELQGTPKTAVVFLDNQPDADGVIDQTKELSRKGTEVIAVSLFTPRCLDQLPDSIWKVAAWQYDRLAVEALIDRVNEHSL